MFPINVNCYRQFAVRVKSNDNVTEGVSFYQKIMSPKGAVSFL